VRTGEHAQSRDSTKAIENAQTPEYRPSNHENVLTIFNSKLLAPSADHRPSVKLSCEIRFWMSEMIKVRWSVLLVNPVSAERW
jgi:hypothetical protein